MKNPGNILKKFAINIGINFAVEIVRGYLNEQIKNINPGDLYEAIIKNQDLWTDIPEDIKKSGRKLKKTYGNIFEKFHDQITPELLLQWMKEDHPDLYSTIINTPNQQGIIWFANQVEKIKKQILYM